MVDQIIRPSALPNRASPNASEKVPVDNGSTVGGATIESMVLAGRPTASQSEAEAGTDPSKAMTPLTTRQAIDERLTSSPILSVVARTGSYTDLIGAPPGLTDGNKGDVIVSGSGTNWSLARVFDTVALGLADATMTYASGPGQVTAGQRARFGVFDYEIADESAIDHHLVTAGGVKLYALADGEGFISTAQMGAVMDGATDDAPNIWKTIRAAIASGCNALISKGGVHLCSTRIGTFDNIDGLVIAGWGAEIKNAIGITGAGLLVFGDTTRDANNLCTGSTISVRNVKVLGIKFTSTGMIREDGRWNDMMPIEFNTSQYCYVGFCQFNDMDFASINFAARCLDCSVENCQFLSSRTQAGHANYGVRIFCDAAYTSFQNGDGDLSPTDTNTGILKAGYALMPDNAEIWGHERVNVRNCLFVNMSHSVMLSAAKDGVISGNMFVNPGTRTVSLTTYSQDYLVTGNSHYLDTEVQQGDVSTFIGIGQETYRHKIVKDVFTVMGPKQGLVNITPIRCYYNSHQWLVEGNKFFLPDFANAAIVYTDFNVDGVVKDNDVNAPLLDFFALLETAPPLSPGYNQKSIIFKNNRSNADDFAAVFGATSTSEPLVFDGNEHTASGTRFIAHGVNDANKRVKLICRNNLITGNPVRYIDNVGTQKAILLELDVIEIDLHKATAGGLAPSDSESVTFDWSDRLVPACFDTRSVQYTAYGVNPGLGTMSGDITFTPSGFTDSTTNSATMSGTIARASGGSGFMLGNVAVKVRYLGLIT